MELYFYFLKGDKVDLETCEVTENPKTYRAVGKFPQRFYGQYVKKSNIGEVVGMRKDIVILTEQDERRACKVFAEYIKRQIDRNDDFIRHTKMRNEELWKQIKILERFNGNL